MVDQTLTATVYYYICIATSSRRRHGERTADAALMPELVSSLLEPCAVQVACTVLRGKERSNALLLPGPIQIANEKRGGKRGRTPALPRDYP